MAMKNTATPWNLMLPENHPGSTSQEKNSKGVFKNDYAKNGHNWDT